MAEMSSDNRRLQERRPYYGRVEINAPAFPSLDVRARDISEGGVRLVMAREVRVGDRVRFELETEAGKSMTVEAEVRNVTPLEPGRFAVGLRWMAAPESSGFLGNFVESVTRWVA